MNAYALLALVLLLAPRPGITSVTGGGRVGPDSSVTLGIRAYVRNKVAGDTLRFDYRRNDTLLVSHRKPFASTDSLITPAPAYGQTATYKGCAQLERGGRTSGKLYPAAPMCWTWTYTRPTPDPVLDSVKQIVLRPPMATAIVTLAGVTPAPMNQVQWCAFAVLKSGARVKMQNSWNIPSCETAYQSWLNERLS